MEEHAASHFYRMASGKQAAVAHQVSTSTESCVYHCSDKCSIHPLCQSFTYDDANHNCVLNVVAYDTAKASVTSVSNSVNFYDRIEEMISSNIMPQ